MAGATKSRGVGGKDTSSSASSSFIGWFFRPAMLFQMSLVAGALALWPYAVQNLPPLVDRAEYRLSFHQIQVQPVPNRPVPEKLLEQAQALCDLPDEFSILEKNLTTEIAKGFRRHPWVSKVVRVRKTFPAAVIVELEYRTPIAMVQVPGGRIPVDLAGVVLPTADFSTEDAARLPLIVNVAHRQDLRPGAPWDDTRLLAAIQLADLLNDKWASLKLEAISVPQRDTNKATKDLQLELVGRGGSRILWGRAPGDQYPGELDPTQKVRRIEKYLADFGDYVRPNGPYEIDIRHWQEISRHALVTPGPVPTKTSKAVRDETRHQTSDSRKKSRH